MNVLTVTNLYVSIDEKPIIENLSFELAERDALGIPGPNGAGKTIRLKTLLKSPSLW